VLTLVALSGLAVVVWRRRAKQRNPQTKSAPFNAREARQGQAQRGDGESPLSLADAALLYERAVIELPESLVRVAGGEARVAAREGTVVRLRPRSPDTPAHINSAYIFYAAVEGWLSNSRYMKRLSRSCA
jgi:acyl-CoA synthetase (NDP forming)